MEHLRTHFVTSALLVIASACSEAPIRPPLVVADAGPVDAAVIPDAEVPPPPGCKHECGAAGLTRCAGGDLETCVQALDGCRQWGPEVECATRTCANSQTCVECGVQCETQGEERCRDGLIEACDRNGAGCLAWQTQEICSTGACRDETACACQHGCAQIGLTSCADGQLSICGADDDGCRVLTSTTCDNDNCFDALTCDACEHACEAGFTSCTGGVLQACTADDGGCRQLVESPCATGTCDDANTCGECRDACPNVGATSCGLGQLSTCEDGPLGCRVWGAAVDCADGFCDDNAACGVCTHECTLDEVSCAGGDFRTCQADINGCRSFGPEAACPEAFCANPASCGTCNNRCTLGETSCAAGALSTCVADANGCLDFGPPAACLEGFCDDPTSCGVCENTCATAGESFCASAEITICAEDANGCLLLSESTPCGAGFCEDETSCGECDDSCLAGSSTCAAGVLDSCVPDQNGCLDIATSACPEGFCADEQVCGTCEHACPALGATECRNGELKTCGADGNGCRQWSAPVACLEGFCNSGQTDCGSCDNTCSDGDTECLGGLFRRCEEDGNGCFDFGVQTNCPDGCCADADACGVHECNLNDTVCSDGDLQTCEVSASVCRSLSAPSACDDGFCEDALSCGVCVNECDFAGQIVCDIATGSFQTCEVQNFCLALTPASTPCAEGFCSDADTCGACTHECAAIGTTECVSDQQRSCGQDINGCRTWGPFSDCPEGDGFCDPVAPICGLCPAVGAGGCTTAGELICQDGESGTRTCITDNNGCLVYDAPSACPNSGFCEANACAVCDHECPTVGVSSCTAGTISDCTLDINGCRKETSSASCGAAPLNFCSSASSCGTCTDPCSERGTTCLDADTVRLCIGVGPACQVPADYDCSYGCSAGDCTICNQQTGNVHHFGPPIGGPVNVTGFAQKGGVIYVGGSNGLYAYDVTLLDAVTPRMEEISKKSLNVKGVHRLGDRLYVLHEASPGIDGVMLFDISNPGADLGSPGLIEGAINFSGVVPAHDIAKNTGRFAVAVRSTPTRHEIRVYNVGVSGSIVEIGLTTRTAVRDIALSDDGSALYVAGNAFMQITDVATINDPATGGLVSTRQTGPFKTFTVAGNTLYSVGETFDNGAQFIIFDISTPLNPTATENINSNVDLIANPFIAGDDLYVTRLQRNPPVGQLPGATHIDRYDLNGLSLSPAELRKVSSDAFNLVPGSIPYMAYDRFLLIGESTGLKVLRRCSP